MMRKWKLVRTFGLVILLCSLSTLVFGADINLAKSSSLEAILKRGVLRVGCDPMSPPVVMKSKTGELIGFELDYAHRMAKAMGVKLEMIDVAWDGIIPSLMSDKFDIIMNGLTITAERNLKVAFSDPHVEIGQVILLSKKHEATVKSYLDLNSPDYLVVSSLGTTGEWAVKEKLAKARYKGFDSVVEAALEVINGKADAMVFDSSTINYIYAKQGKDTTVVLGEPFTYEALGWAIKKGDPDFLNWLNAFIRQSKGDGFNKQAYQKWFVDTSWQKDVE
jgi:polar amino acid transport system substrate-binding protein